MKRLLLDTQVLLWWLGADPSLGKKARADIMDGHNEIYISAASTWEISIKKTLGKLAAPDNMDAIVQEENFLELPISLYHGQTAGMLPMFHRDPFDRMLIAQAQAEGLMIVTSDSHFLKYGIRVMDARE